MQKTPTRNSFLNSDTFKARIPLAIKTVVGPDQSILKRSHDSLPHDPRNQLWVTDDVNNCTQASNNLVVNCKWSWLYRGVYALSLYVQMDKNRIHYKIRIKYFYKQETTKPFVFSLRGHVKFLFTHVRSICSAVCALYCFLLFLFLFFLLFIVWILFLLMEIFFLPFSTVFASLFY